MASLKVCASRGFSLVEVALAIGVAAFVLVVILALLPIGMKSNRTSVEETRGTGILTALEADLRNTHPLLQSGRSLQFGLPLPYAVEPGGRIVWNPALTTGSIQSASLGDSELPVAVGEGARYQAHVIYTRTPSDMPPSGLGAVEARLVVNWPPLTAPSSSDVTDLGKVAGFVETRVAFPAP